MFTERLNEKVSETNYDGKANFNLYKKLLFKKLVVCVRFFKHFSSDKSSEKVYTKALSLSDLQL